MRHIAFALYAILCIIMATATVVENYHGTEFAHNYIYGSWWFFSLWAVAIICSVPCVPKHFNRRHLSYLCFWKRNSKTKTLTILMFALSTLPVMSKPNDNANKDSSIPPHCLTLSQAEKLKYQQVMYNGRVCPLNTVALEFTQKITGKRSFRGLTPEQVLVSWSLYPEDWKGVKMMKTKKRAPLRELGIKDDYAAFIDFFDDNLNYRLQPGKYPDVEERLNIIIMASRGELFQPLDENYAPLSETRVKAEIFYNSIRWNLILFICCFILSVLWFTRRWAKINKTGNTNNLFKWLSLPQAGWIGRGIIVLITLSLTSSLLLRWYISEHIPLTNTFETMQVVALVSLIMSLASSKHRGYALIVSFATLLVTHISSLDPQVTPLMPALQSPWLSSHVTTIMISYALYAILLFRPDRHILIWAEILLATGITLGSIWAKGAWGSYWSWDPKETWALITLIVYMYPLHTKSLPWFRNESHQRWYLRLAFLTVLMTYFGCNYLLKGMHSY